MGKRKLREANATMTSAKNNDNPQARVRSGCGTCRKRHVKCDETRPTCNRCSLANIKCNYVFHLTWEEDALSAGKCHGRAGVWSKYGPSSSLAFQKEKPRISSDRHFEAPKSKGPHSCQRSCQLFLNNTVAHMKLYYRSSNNNRGSLGENFEPLDLLSDCDNLEASATVLDNQFPFKPAIQIRVAHLYTPISSFPFTPDSKLTESFLLEYYSKVICPDATHIRRDDENDPLPYVLLRSSQSRPLFLGVMMSAANLLSLNNPKFVIVALGYRSLVLNVLSELLKSGGDEGVAIFLACMLCSSEVREGHRNSIWVRHPTSWVTHFAAYRHALQCQPPLSVKHKHDYLYKLGCRYFAYHLVISKTTFPIDSSNIEALGSPVSVIITPHLSGTPSRSISSCQSWTSTENLARSMPEATRSHIDSYSGVSNTLLLLINQTVDLRRKMQTLTSRLLDEIELKRMEIEVSHIRIGLTDLQQTLPQWISTTDQDLATHLQKTAEAYRLAALVLLHESFTAPSSREDQNPTIQILRTKEKSGHIQGILNLVSEIVSHFPITMSWPLWPLFIAGCSTDSEEDRILVLRLFASAKMKSSLTNIAPALEIVKAVWSQRDLAIDEVCARTLRRRLSHQVSAGEKTEPFETCYGWERVMIMTGSKISLA